MFYRQIFAIDMMYSKQIFLLLFLFLSSQTMFAEGTLTADSAAVTAGDTIGTAAPVLTGLPSAQTDTIPSVQAADTVRQNGNGAIPAIKADSLDNSVTAEPKAPAKKKKSVKKAKPEPSPEELAIADFLAKLSAYTNDTLVAKQYAPPVDSAGNTVPYKSISEMLMKTPVAVDDSAKAAPNPSFLSLIFDDFEQEKDLHVGLAGKDTCLSIPDGKGRMTVGGPASDMFRPTNTELLFNNARIAAINTQPVLTRYTKSNMPDIPEANLVSRSMKENRVSAVKAKNIPDGKDLHLAAPPKPKLWKHSFASSLQVSQAYISENWYQGGESNLNIISDQLFSTNFDNKRSIIFSASIQWKLGVNTSPSDTCHAYKVNEDLFQINSKFGIKAIKDWYYTVSLVFKTQFFNSYPSNSNDKSASLLSPGDLNLGVGMSYNKKIEERKFETSVMLSPLSYNLKFSMDKEIAALSGIPDGKLFENQVGSSFEATFKWEFYPNLSWTARMFYFTNYKYVQSDIETGMDFAFNRYFSTKIYVHARYDDSIEKNKHGNYFQFKELLSFGFNYKFN